MPRTPKHLPSREAADGALLEQTLRDFEIANRRVIDLTERLLHIEKQLDDQESELQTLRARNAELEHQYTSWQQSKAFRTAERVWAIRGALGV
jgi:predicted  nucleic acid-binding Zn-ribbon protein